MTLTLLQVYITVAMIFVVFAYAFWAHTKYMKAREEVSFWTKRTAYLDALIHDRVAPKIASAINTLLEAENAIKKGPTTP